MTRTEQSRPSAGTLPPAYDQGLIILVAIFGKATAGEAFAGLLRVTDDHQGQCTLHPIAMLCRCAAREPSTGCVYVPAMAWRAFVSGAPGVKYFLLQAELGVSLKVFGSLSDLMRAR